MTALPAPPRHHPDDGMLLDYAAGSLREQLSLVVATHLAWCRACRATVANLEVVGGALLDDIAVATADERRLNDVLHRLDEMPAIAPVSASPASDGTPAALRAYLPAALADLAWQPSTKQLATYDVMPEVNGVRTRLLRIRAGAAMPRHTHRGDEFTLVLRGAFSDELGQYGPGDVATTDPTVVHKPIATRDEDCYCLAVTNAPLRLTGLLGLILNPFLDF